MVEGWQHYPTVHVLLGDFPLQRASDLSQGYVHCLQGSASLLP